MCFVDWSCMDSHPFYSDMYLYNMPNSTVKNKLVVNETFVTIWQLHTGSWLTFQLILCQGSTCSTAQEAQITATHCFTHRAAAARACLNGPVYKNLGFSKSTVIHHYSLPLKSSQEGYKNGNDSIVLHCLVATGMKYFPGQTKNREWIQISMWACCE